MSDSQSAGGIHYDVSMDIKELLVGEKQVNKVMDNVEKSTDKATDSLNRLDKTASQVATAMKMPEINKLSRDMAQLSGKIGANSAATDKAMQSHNRFTGVLSTVSSQLGAGYVGNVGSATASLINHTKAAIEATQAELANAEANKKQAETYQASAAQMVLNAKEEKAAAQSAIEAAKEKVAAADSLTVSLEKQYGQLQQQVKIQRELLKDAEATYQIAPKAENYQAVVTARNKMMATEKKMQAIGNQIDKEQAAASLALQKAKEAEIAASAKVTAATALEQKAKATLTTTNEAVAAATTKATAATQAQSIAMNGLNGVMALLGGPTGLLLLAAAGVYALYDAMTNDSAVKEYNAKIDEMIKKLDTLTSRQAEVVASELQARLVKNNQEISKLKDQISETKRMLDLASSSSSPEMKGAIESGQAILRKLETNLNSAMEAQIRMNGELKRAEKATKENTNVDNERSAALEVFNSVAKGAVSSNKLLAKTIELGSPAAASMAIELSLLEKQLLDSGVSAEEAERQVSNFRNILEANKSMDFELMLQGIEENVQALKIEMEEGKDAAIEYLATVQMAKAGISDDGMLDRLISGLREQHALQTKISNGKKKGSGGKKDKAGDELKRQQNEVAALNKRFELLSTGVADANRDMAMFEAVQKLGSKATNKQKEAAEKEAAEIYDLTQKVNDFIRAQEATPELKLAREFGEEAKTIRRMFDEGFIDKETFTRLGREATQAFEQGMSDIRIETTSNNIITDIGENRAKFDPIQALANENTRKLAMMKEYYDQEQKLLSDSYATQKMTHEQYTAAKSATDMQYHMLITAMDKQYQQQQLAAQWELMRQQNLGYEMLASAVDSLAGNASNVITGLMTGTMSAADAMRSLGNTILNSVVNSIVQVGVEMLKNFILDQTIRQSANAANILAANAAGAAALAAWTPAAIAASIATGGAASATGLGAFKTSMLSGQAMSMVGLAGARYNGGPVNAGEMYRVGEHGKPEIFKASTGKQYMIPGDNGRVISNKDMQGSGSSMPPIINVYQQASGAAVDVTTEKGLNAQDVVNIVVRNIMEGREISGAVSTHHNAPRKAVGSL
ncbi:hypothetical protein EX227_07085 [Providencia rettgeri]|uniref:Tape measure protein n=1 Tax=Providencia rettgeri TaxID=587 RepID=A0AAP2JXR1_PRORE|nr:MULTISPECIES: hypothetical protein [Providencia]MBX6950246.1 hypothetical protein [Providencia rettgeri]MBX6954751.1 hypothetical protein [Providencia rettgeri]MBX6959168.1 hypothetical protein [Providencia rettgeri]MBX6972089.1 hypothetical protein [Providencia rettgeri]MBX6980466.1 hypothetical protein [Providencia rettgeri]